MNGARHNLAAGALLASDHDAGPHRGRPRDDGHHVAHRGRLVVQRIAGICGRAARLARGVAQLAIDRVGDPSRAGRTREYVCDAGEDGFRRQIGPPAVDHRKHENVGMLRPKVARDLKGCGAASEIDNDRQLTPLQLSERGCRRLGPHDR